MALAVARFGARGFASALADALDLPRRNDPHVWRTRGVPHKYRERLKAVVHAPHDSTKESDVDSSAGRTSVIVRPARATLIQGVSHLSSDPDLFRRAVEMLIPFSGAELQRVIDFAQGVRPTRASKEARRASQR